MSDDESSVSSSDTDSELEREIEEELKDFIASSESESESETESVDDDAEVARQYEAVRNAGTVVNEQGLRRSTRARKPVERFEDVHGAAMYALYADDEDDPETAARLKALHDESAAVERLRTEISRTRARIYSLYEKGRAAETAELEGRMKSLQEQERAATAALLARRRAAEAESEDDDDEDGDYESDAPSKRSISDSDDEHVPRRRRVVSEESIETR